MANNILNEMKLAPFHYIIHLLSGASLLLSFLFSCPTFEEGIQKSITIRVS